MKYDLHSHSNHSDGILSPQDLVTRAHAQGVDVLALTDHDIVTGLEEAAKTAGQYGMRLIPGVEISVSWGRRVVHIVGLDIDPESAALQSQLADLQQARAERAQRIGSKLQKAGIDRAYDHAMELAGGGNVTRAHFARVVVAQGKVATEAQAFDKYLAQGKVAYVQTQWATLQQALDMIAGAGGVSVVAHPGRYKMTRTMLKELLREFRDLGGAAMEVVNGGLPADMVMANAALARQFQLLASLGSDFHHPENRWIELGRLAPLPPDLQPVWTALSPDRRISL